MPKLCSLQQCGAEYSARTPSDVTRPTSFVHPSTSLTHMRLSPNITVISRLQPLIILHTPLIPISQTEALLPYIMPAAPAVVDDESLTTRSCSQWMQPVEVGELG